MVRLKYREIFEDNMTVIHRKLSQELTIGCNVDKFVWKIIIFKVDGNNVSGVCLAAFKIDNEIKNITVTPPRAIRNLKLKRITTIRKFNRTNRKQCLVPIKPWKMFNHYMFIGIKKCVNDISVSSYNYHVTRHILAVVFNH